MKKIIGLAVAALAVVVLAGCQTTPPKPPPAGFAGVGEYAYVLRDGSETGDILAAQTFVNGVDDNTVSFDYSRVGTTYEGQMDVSTPFGSFTQCATLQMMGKSVDSTYGGDCILPPGEGAELTDDSPTVSETTTSAACPGQPAFVLTTKGLATQDGEPSTTYMEITYTVCDPVFSAWVY
jgi:hypothetical protein